MSLNTSITLTPLSEPSTITIDGEDYYVSYQTKNAKGNWEERTISKSNESELENIIGLTFARSTKEIRENLHKTKADEDEIALSFEDHTFTDITFSKSGGGAKKAYTLNQIFQTFQSTYFTGEDRGTTVAVYKHLNQLEQTLSEEEAIAESSSVEEEEEVDFPSEPESPSTKTPFKKEPSENNQVELTPYIKDCGGGGHCGVYSLIDQMRIKGLSFQGNPITFDPENDKVEKDRLMPAIRNSVSNELIQLADALEHINTAEEGLTGLAGLDPTKEEYMDGQLSPQQRAILNDFVLRYNKGSDYVKSNEDRTKIIRDLRIFARQINGSTYFNNTAFLTALTIIGRENKADIQIAYVLKKGDDDSHLIGRTLTPFSMKKADTENTLFIYYPNELASHEHDSNRDYQHFQSIGRNEIANYSEALEELLRQDNLTGAIDFLRESFGKPVGDPAIFNQNSGTLYSFEKRYPNAFNALCLEVFDTYYKSHSELTRPELSHSAEIEQGRRLLIDDKQQWRTLSFTTDFNTRVIRRIDPEYQPENPDIYDSAGSFLEDERTSPSPTTIPPSPLLSPKIEKEKIIPPPKKVAISDDHELAVNTFFRAVQTQPDRYVELLNRLKKDDYVAYEAICYALVYHNSEADIHTNIKEQLVRRAEESIIGNSAGLEIFKNIPPGLQDRAINATREERTNISSEAIKKKLASEYTAVQLAKQEELPKSFKYTPIDTLDAAFQTQRGLIPNLEPIKSGEDTVGDYTIGYCHFQGRRPEMEDQHLAKASSIKIGGKEYPIQLFGVFDGHGGSDAAEFLSKNLEAALLTQLQKFNPDELTDEGIWKALKVVFVELNKQYKGKAGSTATVALVINGDLWVANLGDARTILDVSQEGTPIPLSRDAKPLIPNFKKSTKKRDGSIAIMHRQGPRLFNWAGNPKLAIPRAFGDHTIRGISARTKVTKKPLSEIQPGSRLILACDGLWDFASTDEVGAASKLARDKELSCVHTARTLVESAYKTGSEDNLTALVIQMPPKKSPKIEEID